MLARAPYQLFLGNCLDTLRNLPDNSVDSIVTDPPYGLTSGKKGGSGTASVNLKSPHGRSRIGTGNGAGGFMGLKWDGDVPSVEIWAECLRVLKPGGHLLAFAGTRTQHRMAVRIEDAGFEIRDMIAWVYGSGFPKSMDVSKAIDKAAGAARELTRPGVDRREGYGDDWDKGDSSTRPRYDEPATDTAKQWEGWGTALKPALEPITVARKPFASTVAANVLAHGTGALNIGGCRIEVSDATYARNCSGDRGHSGTRGSDQEGATSLRSGGGSAAAGRWPANLIHDGSAEVVAQFPTSDSARANGNPNNPKRGENHTATSYGKGNGKVTHDFRDAGSAARFFYCPKTSRKDRNEGLTDPGPQFTHGATLRQIENTDAKSNNHPTVKPTDLMAYLLRLVTPPGGIALDPFMGSGSTGKAAMREGFEFIGCELDEGYMAIATARIAHEHLKRVAQDKSPENAQCEMAMV
jgi:site-specific DNA-methyltransferase (adenine-specific)